MVITAIVVALAEVGIRRRIVLLIAEEPFSINWTTITISIRVISENPSEPLLNFFFDISLARVRPVDISHDCDSYREYDESDD